MTQMELIFTDNIRFNRTDLCYLRAILCNVVLN